MKYSKLTYCLIAILCWVCTSCINVDPTEGCNNKSQESTEAIKLQLRLAFPTSVTRSNGDSETNERYIKDIHIFTFVDDQLVEEAKNILIDNNDGGKERTIFANLSELYTSGKKVKIVALINTEARNVIIDPISVNTEKSLYNQLTYNYGENSDWTFNGTNHQYIPMWGTTEITVLKKNENNLIKNMQLKRAIAKVNVTVNDGNGLANFKIKSISLNNYNSQGYCAPTDGKSDIVTPYIPSSAVQSANPITFNNLNDAEAVRFEDKIYIPEHKNIGVEEDSKKLSLTITADVKGKEVVYTVKFETKNGAYDILRNNSYVFNITKVNMDFEVESTLIYEVQQWEDVNIDIPPFS